MVALFNLKKYYYVFVIFPSAIDTYYKLKFYSDLYQGVSVAGWLSCWGPDPAIAGSIPGLGHNFY